jgi:hypothetical protein
MGRIRDCPESNNTYKVDLRQTETKHPAVVVKLVDTLS